MDLMDGIKGKRSIQKYKPDPVPTHGPMELVGNLINPVVALNLALRFIKPLAIKGRLLNQCHLLD
jgi:hypothetical protein